jgi:hypothetical protein
MKIKIAAIIFASAAITAAKARDTEILKPDWDSGTATVLVTFPNGQRSNVSARIFGRQDVEKAREFGASLVHLGHSKSVVEQIIRAEAHKRFGNTTFAGFFEFESKMGFSLEVRASR